MKSKAQRQGGYVSSLLPALITVSVLLATALGFGGWAYMSRLDYKNNSDKKAEKAADERQKQTEAADAKKYAEEAKNPLKTYKGPSQFGSVKVTYPKTWSAYDEATGRGNTPLTSYFHPGVVPNTDDADSTYALRLEVVDTPYDQVIDNFNSSVQNGKVSASPYALAKVPGVVGSRLDGQVQKNKQGIMIVLPLRNMTLKVWTESADFVPDFLNIILPNLTFSP